jgi:hypothetical protein
MKKYNDIINLAYYNLNEQGEIPPEEVPAEVPPVEPQPAAPGEEVPEVPPAEEPPVEEEPPVNAGLDIDTVDRIRQALLINRDEIDYDEYSIIQQTASPDNISILSDTIDSILNKSIHKTGEIQPQGPS